MLSYVIHMMRRLLLRLHKFIKFRKELRSNPKLICGPKKLRAVRHQHLNKLHLNPLSADTVSYTHLDVYKRQILGCTETQCHRGIAFRLDWNHILGRSVTKQSLFEMCIRDRNESPYYLKSV